ncbi:hypothetical protein RUND412_008396 [Rhizina undulata]
MTVAAGVMVGHDDYTEDESASEVASKADSECESISLDQCLHPPAKSDGYTNASTTAVASDEQPTPYFPPSLDSPPKFTPLESPFPRHGPQVQNLPQDHDPNSPLAWFRLFISSKEMANLARNTNLYAESKGAGEPKSRPWHSTTIFHGTIQNGGKDFKSRHILEKRWKMYIFSNAAHESSHWYDKLSPITEALQAASHKYLIPGSDAAIDEIMVKFTCRSLHTIKNKVELEEDFLSAGLPLVTTVKLGHLKGKQQRDTVLIIANGYISSQ